MSIVDKAYQFAQEKHDATGKLYNGEAYITHPGLVHDILKRLDADENLLAAACLHDTLEDTETTYEELVYEFGQDIADLVKEVTKDKNKDFPNLKTPRGLMLKVADRLANVARLNGIIDTNKYDKLLKKYSFCFIHEGSHLKKK